MLRTATRPAPPARSARAAIRAASRLGRIRVVALLFGIHVIVGLLGRGLALLAGAADEAPIAESLLVGLTTDAADAALIAGPASVLLVLLPGRWYQSFASWMLIGSVAFAGLAASVCVAIERAAGVVDGGAVAVFSQLTDADSSWVAHPLGMSIALAVIVAALLLGPVRQIALAGFDARQGARLQPRSHGGESVPH